MTASRHLRSVPRTRGQQVLDYRCDLITQAVLGGEIGSCTSYQLRATGQWRPAGADQPNSRRCSSLARAVKLVFFMHAGLRPMRFSSCAMATTPSIQGRG